MNNGDKLRELRVKRGLTQEQIAEKLGITKSSWSMYERGERSPRDEVKVRIAYYFRTTVEELFFKYDEHNKCS